MGPILPIRLGRFRSLPKGSWQNGYPEKISVALIGSCTNSSYEDIERATSIAQTSYKSWLKAQCPLTITPGSEQIHATIARDGLFKTLEEIGGMVLANACGPCIGQWKRHDVAFGEKNSILTSYNRNFAGRNDANPGTHSFVASPEIVIAFSLAEQLTFNPLKDHSYKLKGQVVKLQPPRAMNSPKTGFEKGRRATSPAAEGSKVEIKVDSDSQRLHLLRAFQTAVL